MPTLNTVNYLTNPKWLATVPMGILFPEAKDINLNLIQFDIPDLIIGATEASYLGYEIQYPTGLIQPDTKELTFNYIMDVSQNTYRMLYNWSRVYTDHILDIIPTKPKPEPAFTDRIPISVMILDEWKSPIFKITYYNCWITNFSNVSMSYQDDPTVIEHSFTIAYSNFRVERV